MAKPDTRPSLHELSTAELAISVAGNSGPLVPIKPEEHIAVGVAKGAPRAALEASVTELGTSTAKGLVNLVRSLTIPCQADRH